MTVCTRRGLDRDRKVIVTRETSCIRVCPTRKRCAKETSAASVRPRPRERARPLLPSRAAPRVPLLSPSSALHAPPPTHLQPCLRSNLFPSQLSSLPRRAPILTAEDKNRPSLIGRRHKCSPPQKSICSTSYTSCTAPRRSGSRLSWGGLLLYIGSIELFLYVLLLFIRSRSAALHSFYSCPFYLSPLPSSQ